MFIYIFFKIDYTSSSLYLPLIIISFFLFIFLSWRRLTTFALIGSCNYFAEKICSFFVLFLYRLMQNRPDLISLLAASPLILYYPLLSSSSIISSRLFFHFSFSSFARFSSLLSLLPSFPLVSSPTSFYLSLSLFSSISFRPLLLYIFFHLLFSFSCLFSHFFSPRCSFCSRLFYFILSPLFSSPSIFPSSPISLFPFFSFLV